MRIVYVGPHPTVDVSINGEWVMLARGVPVDVLTDDDIDASAREAWARVKEHIATST